MSEREKCCILEKIGDEPKFIECVNILRLQLSNRVDLPRNGLKVVNIYMLPFKPSALFCYIFTDSPTWGTWEMAVYVAAIDDAFGGD